jgi:RimJ/RimL family protein N-acetyltransferase
VTRILTTARLILSPVAVEDFEDRASCMAEPAVFFHLGGKPMPRHDVWLRLLAQIGHWDAFDYGYWTARTHEGRFVGNIGFAMLERGVVPDFGTAPELGYILSTWAHGQGLASEALGAAHEWLYAKLGKLRTVAMISPENTPSIQLAQRFDYKLFAQSQFKDEPINLYERLIPTAV